MKRQGQQTKRETLSKWKGFFLIKMAGTALHPLVYTGL